MLLRWILFRVLRKYSGEQLEDLAYSYIMRQNQKRQDDLWSCIFRLHLRDPKRRKKNNYATSKKNS